jgi:squalene-associated FAD-dependent desaturase
MTRREVVVIGGGLAGITAAMALRDAGLGVTVLESRPRLGGAASSYARGSMTIDNGQHVFLRCCTAYQELLARLGMTGSVAIQDRFDVTVLSQGGSARLRRTSLPSPLHFAGALAGYRLLSVPERARVARAALAFRFADPNSAALDRVRLGDWLAARGQGERARRRLWDLFVVSALNVAGDDASLQLATTVIKTALLGAKDAADIGMARVPLGELHATAAAGVLDRIGVRVRLGSRVAAIERLANGQFRLGLAHGELAAGGPEGAAVGPEGAAVGPAADGAAMLADGVVLAVPPAQAARLAGPAGFPRAPAWADLGYSPIVNVHVIYDRRVTELPFAAAVDSPVQWVFDKTKPAGLLSGQYLAVSLSAADTFVDTPAAALRELFVPALEQLFPAAAGAAITDFFVTRERQATFRQEPGSGALRPGASTPVPGLTLAGAWTDTGWPDTMEGAVRSGHLAAQVLIGELASRSAAGRPGELDPATAGVS